MRISTRLILSYVGIIIFTTVGMLLFVDWLVELMFSRNFREVENAVESLNKADFKLSQEILTKRGKEFVLSKANETASDIALMIARKGTLNYAALRKDPELRKIATQDVVFDGTVVGHISLRDKDEVSVLHPNRDFEGKSYERWKDQYPEMVDLIRKKPKDKETVGEYTFPNQAGQPEKRWLTSVKVPGTPFILNAVVNVEKTFVSTHEKIKQQHEKIFDDTRASIRNSAETSLYQAKLVGFIGSLFISILGVYFGIRLTRSLSKPILELRDAVQLVGEGDFGTEVKEEGPTEIKQLAQSFNALGRRLSEYMENLAQATAARQRIESELAIAAEMQQSLLPMGRHPFPDRTEFDLCAMMQPARQVGGDFYDFFFLDDDHLCFVIGDVCGKGVPAAILMAVTKSLIEISSIIVPDPGELVNKVNYKLAANNDTAVFVTMFCGVLNVKTGDLAYVNAGHESPLLIKPDKGVTIIGPPTSPAVGLYDEEKFRAEQLKLESQDTLFVFTDGITEAIGDSDRFFTRKRLVDEVTKRSGSSVQELIDGVLEEIVSFTQGVPQADDITMFALKYVKVAKNE